MLSAHYGHGMASVFVSPGVCHLSRDLGMGQAGINVWLNLSPAVYAVYGKGHIKWVRKWCVPP